VTKGNSFRRQPDSHQGPGRRPLRTQISCWRPALTAVILVLFLTPAGEDDNAAAAEERTDYFPGVQAELLKDVRDNTVLRQAEAKAFYHLLKVLQEAPVEKLERAAKGRPALADFFQRPDQYRGAVVTVSGAILRADRILAKENEAGVKTYWQFYLLPRKDSKAVVQVVSLAVPDDFRPEKAVGTTVQFTGFFFKQLAYRAAGREGRPLMRISPLVLAKMLRIAPKPAEKPSPHSDDRK